MFQKKAYRKSQMKSNRECPAQQDPEIGIDDKILIASEARIRHRKEEEKSE
jgi:hypothetical protein